MTTVIDLACQFEAVTGTPREWVLTLLDARGRRNQHLANPLNRRGVPYSRRREVPLTGDEAVHGTFLSLHYHNHDEEVWLTDYDSRAELQDGILSGWGVLNIWTDYFLAFIDGRHCGYEVARFTSDGAEDVVARDGRSLKSVPHEYWASCRVVWQEPGSSIRDRRRRRIQ